MHRGKRTSVLEEDKEVVEPSGLCTSKHLVRNVSIEVNLINTCG